MEFFRKLFSNEPDASPENLQQAKEFFKSMGCSHYHMAHEYPDRYKEYRRLRIPKQTEMVWMDEKFDEYYAGFLHYYTDPNALQLQYNLMYELFLSLRTATALTKMLETTQHLRDRIPMKDRIIFAEIINGTLSQRKDRLGLIYLAYDLKNIAAAKAFLELSLYFSRHDDWEIRDIERCKRAVKLCEDIKLELKL
jgi:hypothetical protein